MTIRARGRGFEVTHFAASCDIDSSGHIWAVFCPHKHRGKGYGKGMMQSIVNMARRTKTKLTLGAGPFYRGGPASMNLEQTVQFYEKFGFRVRDPSTRTQHNVFMEFDPCSTA